MLKINIKVKKYKIPLIFACLGLGGIFLFQYLTFIPEYSSAEEISTDTPVTITPTTPLAKWEDLEYMQQMSPQACENANTGDSKTLIDSRDKTTYTVKRLSDNKCWMTQNLRIVNKAITSADSDVTSDYTIPASSAPWGNSDGATTNKVHYANNTTYGAYYSWYTATAGTAPSGTGTVPSSICPKGWRLPTGGGSGEFQALYSKGSAKVGSFATNSDSGYWLGGTSSTASGAAFFPAGGYVDSSLLKYAGSNGYYWSSTAQSAANAYTLTFTSGGVGPSNYNARYFGLSVRCVAKTTSTETPIDPSESVGSGIINPNISVTVDKILTMEIADKEVNIEPKTNEVMTGNFTATVSSNAGYDIGLSAAEGSPIALVNKKDNVVVAEIPASDNIQVGTNGWGIKCIEDNDNCIIKNYNALTLYNNPQIYFSSTNPAANKPTKFEVGIGISPSLPSGTYSTNILVTASQK